MNDVMCFRASVAAFLVLGLEYSAEMTFPIPEGTSAAVFYFIGTVSRLINASLYWREGERGGGRERWGGCVGVYTFLWVYQSVYVLRN